MDSPTLLSSIGLAVRWSLQGLLRAMELVDQGGDHAMLFPQAGETSIGWALGYMLNLTNMIPAEAPAQVKGHIPSLWAAAITFIILTLAMGIVALLLLLWV